jgi:hypothetical protein
LEDHLAISHIETDFYGRLIAAKIIVGGSDVLELRRMPKHDPTVDPASETLASVLAPHLMLLVNTEIAGA